MFHLLVRDLYSFVVLFVFKKGTDFQASGGFSSANEFQNSFIVNQRLAAQLLLMKENIRCSMGFHLEEPGG